MSQLHDLADRVDRLLLRHEELERTNVLLKRQIDALAAERDQLRNRLGTARTRIDELIARLPSSPGPADPAP
jgi:cell division protein ZapB